MFRELHLFRVVNVVIVVCVVIVVRIVDFGSWCLVCFDGFVPKIEILDVVGKVLGSTSQVGYPKGCFVMNPRSGLKMNPCLGYSNHRGDS